IAAAVNVESIKELKIDFEIQTVMTGRRKRLLDVGMRQLAEVRPFQQPAELVEQPVELSFLLCRVELREELRVGIGIERRIRGLERFELRVIFEVQRRVEQLAEAAEAVDIGVRESRLLAESVDQFRFANGNEVLETRRLDRLPGRIDNLQ